MGPKRRSKNEIKQNENKINQTKNNNDNNSTSRRKNSPQKTTQKKQTKSKGFFCCCGSAEDIYHREIQRPDETPLPPQPPAPSKDQSIRNNKINTNTGSTISVASTNNSGPPSLHSQLPTNYLSRNQQELNNNNNNNNGNGNGNNNNNSNNNNSNSHNTTNNNNNNNTNNTNSTVIPIPLETSRRQPTSSSSIAASTSTNNRPHPNTRLNSKEIGGDVTELDTSVSTAEKKLPQTRSFLENSTNNINTSTSGLKSTQSRHDMSKQLNNNNNNNNNNTSNNVSNNNGNNNNNNINNISNNNSNNNNNNNNNNGNSNNNNNNNNSNTNTGRDQSTLHGVYGTVANPVAVTASSNSNGFNEMNRMYDVIGIKFERPQTTMGEQIAAIGDAHLIKLEEGCKILLEKIREEKAQRYRYFSELSSTDDSTISNTTPPPVSGDYTEVALIFTEVLQLQNRSKDAVTVLSKAIEMLNSDLIFAKNHRQSSNSNIMTNNNSPNNSSSNVISTSPNTASSHLSSNTKISYVTAQEFEQLKKMKGYCHRRLGSLYKLLSRFPEAEEHIKKYISILSRQGNNTTIRRDKANAYALLATIYELMDKREEAVLADKQALELVSLNTI